MDHGNAQVKRFLVNAICFSILCTLFIPLVLDTSFFFPYIVGRNIMFRYLVIILGLLYSLLCILDTKYLPRLDKITVGFFALLGGLTIVSVFGFNWDKSFWGNYERMGGLLHYIHLFVFFVVVKNFLQHHRFEYVILNCTVAISYIVALLGLAQVFETPILINSSGGARVSATLGNPTFLASYLLLSIWLTVLLAHMKQIKSEVIVYTFLAVDLFLVFSQCMHMIFGSMPGILSDPLITQVLQSPVIATVYLFLHSLAVVALINKKYQVSTKAQSITTTLLVLSGVMLNSFVLIHTQTRGALLGLLIGFALYLAWLSKNAETKQHQRLAVLIGCIVVFTELVLYSMADTLALLITSNAFNRVIGEPMLLACVGSILVVFLYYAVTSVVLSKKTKLATVSLVLVVSIGVAGYTSSRLQDSADLTTQSRLLAWQASLQSAWQSPMTVLLGYGLENYNYAFNANFPLQIYKDEGSQIWFDRAHNALIDIIVTTGLLGIVLYGGIAFLILKELVSQITIDKRKFILIIFFVAYVVQNIFVFDTINSQLLIVIVLAIISAQVVKSVREETAKQPKAVIQGVLVAMVILTTMGVSSQRIVYANTQLFKAITPATDSAQADKYFANAFKYVPIGEDEVNEQFINFASREYRRNTASAYAQQRVLQAITRLEASVLNDDQNARKYLLLAQAYNTAALLHTDNTAKALLVAQRGGELSARPHFHFERAQSYMIRQQYQEALMELEKGLLLAPWVENTYWRIITFGIIAQQPGIVNSAINALIEIDKSKEIEHYQHLIKLYESVQNTEAISDTYERALAVDSANIDLLVQAAEFHARIGNTKYANELISQAQEIDPTLELFVK